MIFGTQYHERPTGWHRWFAWRPVKLVCGRWAWLQFIERRYLFIGSDKCSYQEKIF